MNALVSTGLTVVSGGRQLFPNQIPEQADALVNGTALRSPI